METIRTIKIHAQEVQKSKKEKFIACSAEINGKWYKVKFVKGVADAPAENGIYDLTIDIDACSFEKGKYYQNSYGEQKRANDIIWVRNIVALRKHTEEELKEENRAVFGEIFDEE